MAVPLPTPVALFFELSNKEDSAPLDRCFVTDAAVHDEKQTHQGLTEIRNWFIEAKRSTAIRRNRWRWKSRRPP